MPITPMEVSASLTSSSLNGLMIASIFFIRDPPGRVHSNRRAGGARGKDAGNRDRKSTRLNSSHSQISYAVFFLKKKSILSSRHSQHSKPGFGFLKRRLT